jgi:hypothetical protein
VKAPRAVAVSRTACRGSEKPEALHAEPLAQVGRVLRNPIEESRLVMPVGLDAKVSS